MTNGLPEGTVRLADGSPALGAAVFLDAPFRALGESDDTFPGSVRTAVQNEDGEWKWGALPMLPQHEPLQARTDANGRYAFKKMPELSAWSNRRVKIWAEMGDQVSPRALVPAEGESVHVAPITLGPALRPKVRVVTRDGAAVPDAHVSVTLAVMDELGDYRQELNYRIGARTDGTGLAVLPAVPARSDWRVLIAVRPRDLPRHAEMDVSPRRLQADDPLEMRISAGCTVRGRVELPDGSPGVGVHVSSCDGDDRHPAPNMDRWSESRSDGSFELRAVPTESAFLMFVESPPPKPGPPDPTDPMPGKQILGEQARSRLTRLVHGREGETVDLGTVRLSPTLTISGKVLGPSGEHSKQGYVMIDVAGRSQELEPDGTFKISCVPPGFHTITATLYGDMGPWGERLEATLKNVKAGSKGVEIQVTGGGNLIVHLHPVGEPDRPLMVWGTRLSWGGGGGGGSRKSSTVRVTLEPGRRSDIRIAAEGYKTKSLGPIEILADRKTVVDVELELAE